MRDEVRRWHESQVHDTRFRTEVDQALRDVDEPTADRVPHDHVISSWRQQGAELERRAAGQTG
jgi:hypothetical protein